MVNFPISRNHPLLWLRGKKGTREDKEVVKQKSDSQAQALLTCNSNLYDQHVDMEGESGIGRGPNILGSLISIDQLGSIYPHLDFLTFDLVHGEKGTREDKEVVKPKSDSQAQGKKGTREEKEVVKQKSNSQAQVNFLLELVFDIGEVLLFIAAFE
ncbi:Uncharacterized protein Fot_38309 [Forsythia ovata]|uniref:Uncharacterized protein n=1 Tax=Forsythia ovata TaxID=205694 RepID=A0ABD1S1K4_9LAMI